MYIKYSCKICQINDFHAPANKIKNLQNRHFEVV